MSDQDDKQSDFKILLNLYGRSLEVDDLKILLDRKLNSYSQRYIWKVGAIFTVLLALVGIKPIQTNNLYMFYIWAIAYFLALAYAVIVARGIVSQNPDTVQRDILEDYIKTRNELLIMKNEDSIREE